MGRARIVLVAGTQRCGQERHRADSRSNVTSVTNLDIFRKTVIRPETAKNDKSPLYLVPCNAPQGNNIVLSEAQKEELIKAAEAKDRMRRKTLRESEMKNNNLIMPGGKQKQTRKYKNKSKLT